MSDDGLLNISYATLSGAQDELGKAYLSAKNTIDDLISQLNQGLADWTGDARETYAQVQVQWNQAFTDMAAVVQRASAHLGNTHDLMQSTERSNTAIWNG